MQAFTVQLKPSKQRRMAVIVLHTLAIAVTIGYFTHAFDGLILGVAFAISFAFAWAEPLSIHTIKIDPQQNATLLINQKSVPATLQKGSVIHPSFCFLKWQINQKTQWQCVFPDSTDAENFRRLRVWALFCQKKQ